MTPDFNEMRHVEGRETGPLFYPGLSLTQAQRERVDRYAIGIGEVSADVLAYALSGQLQRTFQMFFSATAAIVGDDAALHIAEAIGEQHGGGGYQAFLESKGLGAGSPRLMAEYQDLAHSLRGPLQASALYARFDDRYCIVRRSSCVYFPEAAPELGKYTGAFERGCFSAYKRVDKNIESIEVSRCRWQGDHACEIVWSFRND